MENCEYHLGKGEANVRIRELPEIFLIDSEQSVCKVRIEQGERGKNALTCHHSNLTSEECPLALYYNGKISLPVCNERLQDIAKIRRKLFGRR